MKLDTNSLAHTKWECKYHIVFAPKYRRQIIYGKIKADIGQMLRKLCEYKGIELLEAEARKDHIHMLVSIPLDGSLLVSWICSVYWCKSIQNVVLLYQLF